MKITIEQGVPNITWTVRNEKGILLGGVTRVFHRFRPGWKITPMINEYNPIKATEETFATVEEAAEWFVREGYEEHPGLDRTRYILKDPWILRDDERERLCKMLGETIEKDPDLYLKEAAEERERRRQEELKKTQDLMDQGRKEFEKRIRTEKTVEECWLCDGSGIRQEPGVPVKMIGNKVCPECKGSGRMEVEKEILPSFEESFGEL